MEENPIKVEPTAIVPEDGTQQEKDVEGVIRSLLTRTVSESEKKIINNLNYRPQDCLSPEQFSKHWKYLLKETSEIFREKLSNKILVDLGGADGLMQRILQEKGIIVKVYANVDRMSHGGIHDNKVNLSGDMLQVMLGFADNSIDGISINGIDDMIIDSDDYHKELANQIKRVLKSKGIVFGINSEALSKLISNQDFIIKWQNRNFAQICAILEKK